MLIYEGYCQAQGGLVGGGAQVFIPHSVIEALQYWQTQKRESVVKGIKGLIEAEMKWRRAQMEIIKQWHLKLLETVASNIDTKGKEAASLVRFRPQFRGSFEARRMAVNRQAQMKFSKEHTRCMSSN